MAEPIRATKIEDDTYGFQHYQRQNRYESFVGFQLPDRTALTHDRKRDAELNLLKEAVLTHVQYWVRTLDEKIIRIEQRIKDLEERDDAF